MKRSDCASSPPPRRSKMRKRMGEAVRNGELVGSATGATKAEVLDALERAHPDADEIRIRTLKDRLDGEIRQRDRGFIDKPFAYHKPSPDGLDKITTLREGFSR